jgi:photosystem II stability/assembly factor-like uncharacterized protein
LAAILLVVVSACGETGDQREATVPSHAWAAGGVVLRSSDGGARWDLVRANDGLRNLDFLDRAVGWAVGGTTILRTGDGGLSWEDQTDSVPVGFFLGFGDVAVLGPARAVVVGGFAPVGTGFGPVAALLTTDGGVSWERAPVDARSNPTVGLATLASVCATEGGIVLSCGSGLSSELCLLSEDSGSSWADVSDRVIGVHVACAGPRNLWVLRSRGTGLLQSVDGGATWNDRFDHLPDDFHGELNAVVFADGRHGWLVGTMDGRPAILHTADGGDSWTRQDVPSELRGAVTAVAFVDAFSGVAVGGEAALPTSTPFALRTRDGGRTWERGAVPDGTPHLTGVDAVP